MSPGKDKLSILHLNLPFFFGRGNIYKCFFKTLYIKSLNISLREGSEAPSGTTLTPLKSFHIALLFVLISGLSCIQPRTQIASVITSSLHQLPFYKVSFPAGTRKILPPAAHTEEPMQRWLIGTNIKIYSLPCQKNMCGD